MKFGVDKPKPIRKLETDASSVAAPPRGLSSKNLLTPILSNEERSLSVEEEDISSGDSQSVSTITKKSIKQTPFVSRVKGYIKNFGMILNFKKDGKTN